MSRECNWEAMLVLGVQIIVTIPARLLSNIPASPVANVRWPSARAADASWNPLRFSTPPTGPRFTSTRTFEPVAMDENDARDEINRLSETLGKATLLPMPNTKGAPSGLIASWGAVSLQPLDPARTAELAAGNDDKPGILVDTIGNPQRSAQLGLPIYRLGGGAGYVWSASWNGRGRGALRMLAIDASRLPRRGPKRPSHRLDPAAIVSAPTAPTAAPTAPTSPPSDGQSRPLQHSPSHPLLRSQCKSL